MPSAIRLASALFFFSGAAALIFEALWFRRAGLAFGNSVWASALVLSSFMAGMAVGNAVAARYAARLRSPLRTYGVLEVVIAIVGIALVAILPMLGPALAPIFEPLLPTPWLLQPLRFAIAFAVMVAPAVAMGATLPVLIHALRERDSDFGHLLGRLYGWNTLGAMFGAASAELIWIQIGGIWGSAAIAALLNLAAAAGALVLRRQLAESRAEITSSAESPPASTGFEANPSPRSPLSARAWRLRPRRCPRCPRAAPWCSMSHPFWGRHSLRILRFTRVASRANAWSGARSFGTADGAAEAWAIGRFACAPCTT